MSVDSWYVARVWKVANMTPVKKNNGVCLRAVVGKMQESITTRNIEDHQEKQRLFHYSRYGFTKGRSFFTNHFSFYNKVVQAVDRNENYHVLYLDSSKAFDKAPHLRLLLRLQAQEVDGKVLGWMKAWLSNTGKSKVSRRGS